MTLTILRLTNEFVGDYFCHAANELGSDTRAVSVRIRSLPNAHNVSECCVSQNVSSACMDACSFYIDIDAVKNRPECIVDFDKLMKCAADGSDHRSCCANGAVPRYCLNWCRGEPISFKITISRSFVPDGFFRTKIYMTVKIVQKCQFQLCVKKGVGSIPSTNLNDFLPIKFTTNSLNSI